VDGKYAQFNVASSAERLNSILDQPTGTFEETNSLPDRTRLSYTNGFYANCSAIFVDIRQSAQLPDRYNRPQLAKLYRAFISEMVAVLNSSSNVREVNIVGDCVWAVYNTPKKTDIDDVFDVVARANSMHGLLNRKLVERGFDALSFGIGVDWGRALMIKAGYFGSGINEVVYMGDIVNRAAHLAANANKNFSLPVFLGGAFANNLNEHNASLVSSSYNYELGNIYTSGVHMPSITNYGA
jgi:class 3 adenylate cyclase